MFDCRSAPTAQSPRVSTCLQADFSEVRTNSASFWSKSAHLIGMSRE